MLQVEALTKTLPERYGSARLYFIGFPNIEEAGDLQMRRI
jgi:hypothetical protein